MIDSIELKNFQAHSSTKLEFHKGVNIIVGRSDQGKSSIIRALRWVVTNRPTGIAFRKQGTDMVSVTLSVDGTKISRDKSDKVNRYVFKGEEYKALRSDVPTVVSDVLNFGIANIQTQHEQYFLLQSSPGDAAKTINTIANLQIIGDTIRNANSYIAGASHKVQVTNEMLQKVTTECDSLAWAEGAYHAMARIDDKQAVHDGICSDIQFITSRCAAAITCKTAIARLETATVAQKLPYLRQQVTAYKTTANAVAELQRVITTYKQIEVDRHTSIADIDITSAKDKSARYTEVVNAITQLTLLVGSAEHERDKIHKIQTEYIDLRRTQRRLKEQVKICPTCGQIIQRGV